MPHHLFVILHNLRSAYNVGSIFRTADSAGIQTLYLTGYTAVPPSSKLQKTALGALDYVRWEHHCDPLRLIKLLKSQNITVWSCEPVSQAKSLYEVRVPENICLVFGNEVKGIDQAILSLSNQIIKIPQFGKKESLNVATAAGICIYECRRQLLTGKVN